MRRMVGFTFFVIGLSMPLAAHAQEIHPCTPIAPGVRCVQALTAPFGRLDFGAPKPKIQTVLDEYRSERAAALSGAHSHRFSEPLRAPEQPSQAGCASLAAAHSADRWFAPALPPLPKVQTVQPFLTHGHTVAPASRIEPVGPCR